MVRGLAAHARATTDEHRGFELREYRLAAHAGGNESGSTATLTCRRCRPLALPVLTLHQPWANLEG